MKIGLNKREKREFNSCNEREREKERERELNKSLPHHKVIGTRALLALKW